jgi:hypothetical protein
MMRSFFILILIGFTVAYWNITRMRTKIVEG